MEGDHYSVTLFGVGQISDINPRAKPKTCEWNDPIAACFPAPGEDQSYALLARARWMVLVSLGMVLVGLSVLRVSRRTGPRTAFPFVIAGVLVGASITNVRANVARALAAFAGTRVSMTGIGMTAAGIATLLCFIAALTAAIPRSRHRTRVRRAR